MHYSRRDLGKLALAAWPAARALGAPNSKFGGVQVGIIAPYSFREMPHSNDADMLLKNIVQLGLGAVEMQSPPVEAFAGAPLPEGGARGEGDGTDSGHRDSRS